MLKEKNDTRKEMRAKWEKGEEAAAKKKARQEAKAAKQMAKQEAIRLKKVQAETAKKAKETAILAKKVAKQAAKEKARQEAEAARKAKEDAIMAKKVAKQAAEEKARQEAEVARKAKEDAIMAKKVAKQAAEKKARQEAEAARKAKEDAILAKKVAKQAAKEKARQEAEAARKAREAAILAKKEEEKAEKERVRLEAKAARERAKHEAEVTKKAREAAILAKKEEEKAAKEKARQGAEAAKRARETALLAKKEEEKAAKERARQEAETAKKAGEVALLAKKEEEKAAKEKARQEAEVAKRAGEAALLAKKEEEKAAKEMAMQEAEAAKRAREAALLAKKEEEKAAKERAMQEAEAAKRAREATLLAKKEEEKAAKEMARQEAEAAKKAGEAALLARKEAEAAAIEKEKQLKAEIKKAQEAISIAQKDAAKAIKEKEKQEVKVNQEGFGQEPVRIKETEVASPAPANGHKTAAKMVPLFSKRSITVMIVGLIVGIGLGLGYWIISPSLSTSSAGMSDSESEIGGLPAILGLVPKEPWTSTASIQVVSSGSIDILPSELAAVGQSHIVKLQSLPFLNYLKQAIDEEMPQYSHTEDELGGMFKIGYDSKSAVPTLTVTVTASTIEETTFLAGFIPETFQNYLATQAVTSAQQQYQDILAEIDRVKAAGLEAKQELDTIVKERAASDLSNSPASVALTAKIGALEYELDRQAAELVTIVTQGVADEDVDTQLLFYGATPQEQAAVIEASLAEVQQKLKAMELEKTINDTSITNNPTYIMLSAKVAALQTSLDLQAEAMAAFIAVGDTTSASALNAQTALLNLGVAISDAKKELAIMEAEAANSESETDSGYDNVQATASELKQKQSYLEAQEKFAATSAVLASCRQALAATGSSGTLESDVEYQAASSKVDSLNVQLALLNEELGSAMVSSSGESISAVVLATDVPSNPVPVLPARTKARNALMMGAVVGIGGSWFLLNRRWITGSMANQQPVEEDE